MKYSWFFALRPFEVLSNRNPINLIFRRLILCFIFAGVVCSVGVSYGNNQKTSPGKRNIYAERLTHELSTLFASYRRAAPAEQKQLLDDLVALAAERQKLLAQIMEENPGEVFRLALPERLRSAMPGVAKEHLEKQIELEGLLEVLYEDYDDSTHKLYHFLRKSGKRFSLHFKKTPKNLLSGTPVSASGVLVAGNGQTDGAIALESGESLLPLADDGAVDGAPVPSVNVAPDLSNTIGEQRTLVFLVNFQDLPEEPWTAEEARVFFFETLSDFFFENSYHQTWLTGDVFGWLTLPLDNVCNRAEIAGEAEAAAAAAGFDLSSYTRFVYMWPKISCGGWSGIASVGGNPSRAYINGLLDLKLVGHELGHNFGLLHSHGLNCQAAVLGPDCAMLDYGDTMDIMGYRPAHFNGFQKERLGWLDHGSLPALVVVTVDGIYEVGPYESAGAEAKAVKVLKANDPATGQKTWLYLESRQRLGFDGAIKDIFLDGDNMFNGLLVHQAVEGDAGSSHLLDMTPDSRAGDNADDLNDAALIAGYAYTDADSGIIISTESVDGTGAAISVTFSEPHCLPRPPAIDITPSVGPWVHPGASIAYDVAVTNHDSDACLEATFDLATAVPTGWSTEFDNHILALAPGATGAALLTVASPTTASEGFYDVVVTAKHPPDAASVTASYVVSTAANAAPTPTDDVARTVNKPIVIDVLANDSDPDGDPLTLVAVTQPMNGTVVINAYGTVTYRPTKGFKGSDSFHYTLSDGLDAASASVSVTVGNSGKGKHG